MTVNIAILRTDGTCNDEQAYYAWEVAGGQPQMVHVNDFIKGKTHLDRFQILTIPGGFSYGDDILSGKILANELLHSFGEQLTEFVAKGKLILGICNGFQVLVRTGLLPGGGLPAEQATLIFNDSAHFECRWIRLRVEESKSIFTKGMEGTIIEIPVNHGEGKFIVKNQMVLEAINNYQQVAFRYAHPDGSLATDYPANPNGSIQAIAGICNREGTVMGMMPHPERYVKYYQHPNWTRQRRWKKEGDGLAIFRNALEYAEKHL